MKMKLKKGDLVEVITGRGEDKGKRGEIIKVQPDKEKVVVQGVNVRTKHQKQVQAQGRTIKPGKVRLEVPFHTSNVMLVCPKCNKPTRVGLSREGDKVRRICKECEAIIDE
jgi:large subunit ribosomal protein L24